MVEEGAKEIVVIGQDITRFGWDYAGKSLLPQLLEALGAVFEELELNRLRFHLAGESTLVNTLYELLFCHTLGATILPVGAKRPNELPPGCVLPVGFEPEDEVIPYPRHALPSYRLLQEYFLFPEKFHFFDLEGLQGKCTGGVVDLLFLLDRWPPGRAGVTTRNFRLGCTPIVNLFPGTTEPVRIDHRSYEYMLVPDIRRERTTEIHSILAVSASTNPEEHVEKLEPFYSFRHRQDGRESSAFWHARRVPALRGDLTGTDLILSFFDRDFNPQVPPEQVVYAHVLNTNRGFARQLPAGARLQIENVAPLTGITCLEKPTAPVYPPLEGATLWNLVSNMTLSHLSLADTVEGLNALRQILRVYSLSDQPPVQQQVHGILEMPVRLVMVRVGVEPWRGFCRGTEITLTFDRGLYVGTGAFLLGAVLNRFLPLYAAVNSFTELAIKTTDREGEWKRWNALAGLQELI